MCGGWGVENHGKRRDDEERKERKNEERERERECVLQVERAQEEQSEYPKERKKERIQRSETHIISTQPSSDMH